MDEFISRENIKRLKKQLEHPADEQQKLTLEELLKAEEGRLAGLERRRRDGR